MFISAIRMDGLKPASSLLKGWGRGKTHVTLIQEMNGQLEVLLSTHCLWYKHVSRADLVQKSKHLYNIWYLFILLW